MISIDAILLGLVVVGLQSLVLWTSVHKGRSGRHN